MRPPPFLPALVDAQINLQRSRLRGTTLAIAFWLCLLAGTGADGELLAVYRPVWDPGGKNFGDWPAASPAVKACRAWRVRGSHYDISGISIRQLLHGLTCEANRSSIRPLGRPGNPAQCGVIITLGSARGLGHGALSPSGATAQRRFSTYIVRGRSP